MSIRGGVLSRGTSNSHARGSAEDRRRRRAYLVDTFGWRLPDGTGLVCCYRCHVVLLEHEDPDAPGQSVTVDRIVPGVRGGRYTRDNIRPACGGCNSETGGALSRRPTHGPRSTHGSTHGPLPRNVTHEARTAVTSMGITAGQSMTDSTHATHAAGARTVSPPSLQGGTGRPIPDTAA